MWVEDYKWHYDYVRLAWDTGFSFEKCKAPNLDKNKICVVDVDRIVKERDVASVDLYISTVVQYTLDDEQAKVLDHNFVKLFRISQLAVEYLLFCKKYLDNTVVLLKKELTSNREENRELKAFIGDLQAHVETLTRSQRCASFKCSQCSKAFSSEEYLNSHVKRKHSNQNIENYNWETDKLNLEIKELKERLNNTEKLLKEKNEYSPEKRFFENDNSKINSILEQFEKLKNQVDNELKELKIQKSFYEEKYGKLFDIVVQNKENIEPNNQIKEISKTENTTQTDKFLHIENVNDKNVVEIKEPCSSGIEDKNERIYEDEVITSQTRRSSLDDRISMTLAGIESQMQTFWSKLNEIELKKSNPDVHEVGDSPIKEIKPRAKPRNKLSQPTHNTKKTSSTTEQLKLAIEELEQQQKEDVLKRQGELVVQSKNASPEKKELPLSGTKSNASSPSEQSSSSESESTESESGSEMLIQTKNFHKSEPTVGKTVKISASEYSSESPREAEKAVVKPLLSAQKPPFSPTESTPSKRLNRLQKEIEEKICHRLQELGISEHWTRLPEKSFKKALEIVNHQGSLTVKAYPNFNSIRQKISSDIDKQCNIKCNAKTQLEIRPNSSKLDKLRNIVRVSYRPKTGRKHTEQRFSLPSPKRETLEIKNRALYDTDTESEQNFKQTRKKTFISPKITESQRRYSNVVDELKSLPIVKSNTDEVSVDEVNRDAQRGVLKSFPSVGSLSKKKVLFDLASEPNGMEDAQVVQKTGGSTTSIASSILSEKADIPKGESRKEESNVKTFEKDLDDLSEFDLSDL